MELGWNQMNVFANNVEFASIQVKLFVCEIPVECTLLFSRLMEHWVLACGEDRTQQ